MENGQAAIEGKTKPRTGLFEFIRETRDEIAKVTWPTRKETMVTTATIVIMALIAGLFFFGVDSILGFAISHILGMNS